MNPGFTIPASFRRKASGRFLINGLLLLGMSWILSAQVSGQQAAIDSYRRQDWTGRGTYHRLGLLREQENALRLRAEPRDVVPEAERDAAQPANRLAVVQVIREHVSVVAHANSMLFRSDNIFNTETGAVADNQYAQFLGAGFDLEVEPFSLSTTFDQAWFWFDKFSANDFDVRTVRQGLSYSRNLLEDTVRLTLTPSWQYSVLHNRRTSDRFLEQATYGLNSEFAWQPTKWLIGTFSYSFALQDANGASDKYKHDFNVGLTLIPFETVDLFISPSVQFSHERVRHGSRRDNAWTPTLAINYRPLAFLSFDAVISYTDSRANVAGGDFHALGGTCLFQLSWRL